MLNIIKGNWERMLQRKVQLLISILLTLGAMVGAVFFTYQGQSKGNIAVVGDQGKLWRPTYYKVTYLETRPPMSTLVEGRYEAIVIFKSDGSYELQSIKSQEEQAALKALIESPLNSVSETLEPRQRGTTILGYIMMFLLMQGMVYTRLLAEDKEQHQIERIVVSPISLFDYLVGHGIFVWSLVFIPAFLAILFLKLLGVDVGFSIFAYMLLIGIGALLSMAFALCLYSFLKGADSANMIGSAVVILTSILAGSFDSYAGSKDGFSTFIYILPQKSFLYFVGALEKGELNILTISMVTYVIIFSGILIMISTLKIKKDYGYKGALNRGEVI